MGNGRGALWGRRSGRGSATRGATTSANVGMSNDTRGENPLHRKSKGSAARALRGGEVGPKARARAVADGHAVDNRRPHPERYYVTEMLMGNPSDETSVVHAGREHDVANPIVR
jgi:hypothetical protein